MGRRSHASSPAEETEPDPGMEAPLYPWWDATLSTTGDAELSLRPLPTVDLLDWSPSTSPSLCIRGTSFKLGEPLTRLQLLELQAYTRDLEQKLLLYYQASTVGDSQLRAKAVQLRRQAVDQLGRLERAEVEAEELRAAVEGRDRALAALRHRWEQAAQQLQRQQDAAARHAACLAELNAGLLRCLIRNDAKADRLDFRSSPDLADQLQWLARLHDIAAAQLRRPPRLRALLERAQMEAEDLRAQLAAARRQTACQGPPKPSHSQPRPHLMTAPSPHREHVALPGVHLPVTRRRPVADTLLLPPSHSSPSAQVEPDLASEPSPPGERDEPCDMPDVVATSPIPNSPCAAPRPRDPPGTTALDGTIPSTPPPDGAAERTASTGALAPPPPPFTPSALPEAGGGLEPEPSGHPSTDMDPAPADLHLTESKGSAVALQPQPGDLPSTVVAPNRRGAQTAEKDRPGFTGRLLFRAAASLLRGPSAQSEGPATLADLLCPRWIRTLRRQSQPHNDSRSRSDQQRMHKAGIFRAIKEGRQEAVRQLAAQDPSVLRHTDAVGANPIHIAFLYRQTDIGKMLVECYPKLATSVYGEGEYTGENILHIAIIHQDVELVRWLLDRHPELLNAETTGSFFSPGGEAYFGGCPLLFAVSSNQLDLLQCITATRSADRCWLRRLLKNRITTTDCFGNSALHMAVIHDLPEMYDHVVEEMRREGLEDSDVRHWLNAERLTPLALAAALGQERMFQHILAKYSVIAWDYGPITCKLFPLCGLEQPSIDPNSGEAVKTAIDCMCAGARIPVTNCLKLVDNRVPREVEQVRLDLIVSAEVRQVLDKKWDAFGQRMFYRKLAVALGTVLAWTAASILPNNHRCSASGVVQGHPVALAVQALELLVLLSVGWRAVWVVRNWCLPSHLSIEAHGAAAVEATLGNVFCFLFLSSVALRLADLPVLVDVAASFAALTGWLHVFFFLLGFRSTGPFVIMIKEMLQYDVKVFLCVNLTVLLGFTMSLYMLTADTEHCGVDSFVEHLWQFVLLGLVGDFPFETYSERFSGGRMLLINLLVISYIILVVILLLNLLIAMMGNTYSAVQEQAEKRWYLERANLMAAYEAEHTVDEMQQLRKAYATPFSQSDAAVTRDTEFCLTTTLCSGEWKARRRSTSP
eukprot:EG_transcript_820